MVSQRVSLITIGAKELPKLRSFYQKLGWEETEISSDNYCVFKTSGVLLSLIASIIFSIVGISGRMTALLIKRNKIWLSLLFSTPNFLLIGWLGFVVFT
jgi:hypothetical protein